VELKVGLQLHVLNVRLYSLLVLMALLTTAATGPLLSLIGRRTERAGRSLTAKSSMLEPLPDAEVLVLPVPSGRLEAA